MQRQRLPIPPIDIVFVLISTAAIFFSLAFGGKALEGYRLQRHNAILQAELDGLQAERQALEGRLQYVSTDTYVEQVAREQYKWVKAGETLIVTILTSRTPATTNLTPSASGVLSGVPGGSHWAEWWRLLTGGVRR